MAKIRFLDDIAEFNHDTLQWECQNSTVASLLQTVQENMVRDQNDCMNYFSQTMGATVLEWDPDPRIEEHSATSDPLNH